MNSKYYTPEIEEFYIGFEYRLCHIETAQYVYCTFQDGQSVGNLLDGDYGEVDVKYLDKEDIEDLGFTLVENINGFSTFKKEEHILRLFIEDSNEYTIEDPGNIAFQGIIKNKSELKKLLKQLNIK